MIFWISAAFLTFCAALCVMIPLWRNPSSSPSNIEFDKAIYKARLAEIEKDVALGRLTQDEGKAAIAEEGRKLISLASQAGTDTQRQPISGWTVKTARFYGVFLLPLGALAIYLSYGSPDMPGASLASRMAVAPEQQSIEDLVARAEAHLSKNPQDARGWSVLAPVYSRLGRSEDAVRAWATVYRLAPQTPEIRATLGESMVAAADGVITSDARQLFEAELKDNNASAKARFYLAMGLGQEGRHAEAVAAWQELIKGGSDQSPWMEAARQFLAESAKAANIELAPAIAGPTAEQIQSASEMSAEDRNQMIAGMIDNLAGKLEQDPSNKAGWQQLVRSYIVLGRREDAVLATQKAVAHFKDDPAFAENLKMILGTQN